MVDLKPGDVERVLVVAAKGVCDTLEACGMTGNEYAFSLVVWRVGYPEQTGIISAGGDPNNWGETSAALIAASKKSEKKPLTMGQHKSPRKQ